MIFEQHYTALHMGDAACSRLFDLITECNFQRNIQKVTSDSAADMIKGTAAFQKKLEEESPVLYPDTQQFHLRSVAHIINHSVKYSMMVVHDKINIIRLLLNALSSSMKRKYLFNEVKNNLGLKVELPVLDVEAHWSSTLQC